MAGPPNQPRLPEHGQSNSVAPSYRGPRSAALCALARKERAKLSEVTILTVEQRHVSKWRDRSNSKVLTLKQVLDQLRAAR